MKVETQTDVVSEEKIQLPFKAIIFDMDGTLLESTEADYKAWERVFNDFNKRLTFEDYQPLLGIRSADVIKNQLGITEQDEVKRILKVKFDYFIEYVNENPVIPVDGAGTFLKALAQYNLKIGLATSSRKEKMRLLLEQLDFVQYFDTLVTGEEVENSKPAPDIFLMAAQRLGISPEECVVFEDGPIGVAAAKAAGMKCIAITATHPADKLGNADLIIDRYDRSNVADLLKQLVEGKEMFDHIDS